ncbi:alkaline phosphatase D family protein [Aeromicrobium halocynthiae]|uniref:Alkaline phosphatase D family protein n=1 Tax=Aeromicrobium halocynthiae TaxID=560557 RepID=A0ABN2VQ90_9ACTN
MFQHGIASGDPLPTAVVLWTRVSPTKEATPGSGRGPRTTVRWTVATDARMRSVVSSGTTTTTAALDHTVKVDVRGLRPATTYHYRFSVGKVTSAVGTTRTAPAPTARPARLRFGVVSCANYEAGFFSAYRHLAGHRLDAVLHLGDYLYEYATGTYAMGQANAVVRKNDPPHEIVTLSDYRRRHALYKRDPDLQALHRRVPFICTWDDHESANDAFSTGAENHDPATQGSWSARRRAAYRAYDEWMPVRLSGTAKVGDGSQIYRRFTFGRLAELSMLDLRTYRNAPGGTFTQVPNRDAASRSIAGPEQLGWLEKGLATTESQWKLVGNPVMIAPVRVPPLPNRIRDAIEDTEGLLPAEGVAYNTDQWDGYTAERRRVLEFLADHNVTDTVFLTGDIHSGWACDLPTNAGLYPLSTTVATELVCTSVTSNNLKDILGVPPRTLSTLVETAIFGANRHVRYLDFDSHGYSILDVTPARIQMDWYAISDRARKDATSQWVQSWEVPASSQRVRQAQRPSEGAA